MAGATGSTVCCGSARRRDAAAGPGLRPASLRRRRRKSPRSAPRPRTRRAPTSCPDALAKADYDHFRDIRFKPDRSLWRPEGLPFEIAFFHEGQNFRDPVKINELVGDVVREVRFNPELFNYGANAIDPKEMRAARFAGFRLHYAINSPKYKDEVAGVSRRQLFSRARQRPALRAVGARPCRRHGARSGEEFPQFVEFWIRRPAPGATSSRSYALLDSRRMTGAYSFVSQAAVVDTAVDVKARLFLREFVSKPGLRTADDDVFLRREPARRPATTTVPKSTTRTACRSRREPANGSGGRWSIPKRLLVDVVRGRRIRPASASCSATATSSTTRIWKRATTFAPAHGSSRKGSVGNRQSRAGADPQSRRDQRQHRRVLGAGQDAGPAAAVRHRIPHPVAEGRLGTPADFVGDPNPARSRLRPQRRRQHRLCHRLRRARAAQAAGRMPRSRASRRRTPTARSSS